jgi:hypothetical protein
MLELCLFEYYTQKEYSLVLFMRTPNMKEFCFYYFVKFLEKYPHKTCYSKQYDYPCDGVIRRTNVNGK